MTLAPYNARQYSFGQTFERSFKLDQDSPYDWTAAAPTLIVAATADAAPVIVGSPPYLTVTQSDGDETILVMRYEIQSGDTSSPGQYQAWLIVGSADGTTWQDGVCLGGFVIEECPAVPKPSAVADTSAA